MDYGIGIPSYIDAWREVQAAEAAGFTHAWFYDSQLIYSDVYATMALAAQNTSRIKLGTLVAIPSNRIAPVTASAIATISRQPPPRPWRTSTARALHPCPRRRSKTRRRG